MNFVLLRKVFWHLSSCFFQFATTCNANYKFYAESVSEKHTLGDMFSSFSSFAPNKETFQASCGSWKLYSRGYCIFKESGIVYGQKLDFVERGMVPASTLHVPSLRYSRLRLSHMVRQNLRYMTIGIFNE